MNHDPLQIARQRASRQDGTYPRPQLVRQGWCPIDRRVGFAYDDQTVGLEQHWERDPAPFQQTIQLPFPPESSDSGVGDKGYHPCVWYRIPLSASDMEQAGHGRGRRLLLHFGAVDHEAHVFVDGRLLGTHVGGQTEFSFDITDALDESTDEHVVVVRAMDDPLDTSIPRGKQDWLEEPHVIWYHRTTGIWRGVWIESVPELRVDRLTWRTNVATGRVSAHIELNQRPAPGSSIELVILHDDNVLARGSISVADRDVTMDLPLTGQNNGVNYEQLLWAPGHPVLLDAGLTLAPGDGGDPDTVASYLGVRDIDTTADHVLVNFRPLMIRAVLEQGYWPTSHLTPPSLKALRDEVELILELGFNCARIHQKVEDPRFYYWADRLGLLLWSETAAAYSFDNRAIALLTEEWTTIVRDYASHPSIMAWVPFNESWGVTHMHRDPAQQSYTLALTHLTKALDSTRPVISNDGWEHTDSDLFTIHDYEWRKDILQQRYSRRPTGDKIVSGPVGRALILGRWQRHETPIILSEFGGVEYVPKSTTTEHWGYSSATEPEDFERRIRDIMSAVKESPILAGYCWTQITDTLQETNGLCDENRNPKLPVHVLRELMGE